MSPEVSAEDRATLAGLADVLIPAGEGAPSASEAGVAGAWLAEVLRLRPDLADPLAAILVGAGGAEPAAAVARLQAEQPAEFGALTAVVAGAYFLNPDVCRAIGYPGQQRRPIVPEDPPDYERDGLLASVIARGPIYRPTPTSPSPPEGEGRGGGAGQQPPVAGSESADRIAPHPSPPPQGGREKGGSE